MHTMGKYLNHDGLAHGIFNRDYNGASAGLVAWDRFLTNSPPLLDMLVKRMVQDYESLAPKMRKPWGLSSLDSRYICLTSSCCLLS